MVAALANISLRGISAGSRLLLLFVLVRDLRVEDVGIYGLVITTVTLTVYLVGFDFYAFNSREILKPGNKRQLQMIKDQMIVHLMLYVVVVPAVIMVVFNGVLDRNLLFWFVALLLLEHGALEAYRLYITLSKPVFANVVLFCRGGLWILSLCMYRFLLDGEISLQVVLAFWAAGSLLGCFMAGCELAKRGIRAAFATAVDWSWVRKGFRVSALFMVTSVATMVLTLADRYFIDHYVGVAEVGVYTYFVGVAGAIPMLLEAGVFSIFFPRLVASFQAGEIETYRKLMRQVACLATAGALMSGAALFMGLETLTGYFAKPIYEQHVVAGQVLVVAQLMWILSLLPHSGLVVRHMDRHILVSTLVAVGVAISLNFVLVPRWGVTGAAVTTLVASAGILAGKAIALHLGTRSSNSRPAAAGAS